MKSRNEEPIIEYVPAAESDEVSRKLLGWLNQYGSFPAGVRMIDFEYLEGDNPCMALSTIQGAYKTTQYINGGYMAQYQFKLIYRAQPESKNERLEMDEVLNNLGDWASTREDFPYIGEGLDFQSITCDTRSGFFGRYEGGDEDHQILMTMNYERKQ